MFPRKEDQAKNGFIGKLQISKIQVIPVLHKLFQITDMKKEEGEAL